MGKRMKKVCTCLHGRSKSPSPASKLFRGRSPAARGRKRSATLIFSAITLPPADAFQYPSRHPSLALFFPNVCKLQNCGRQDDEDQGKKNMMRELILIGPSWPFLAACLRASEAARMYPQTFLKGSPIWSAG